MGCGKRIGGTNLNRIRSSIIRIVSREIMRDFLFSSLDFRSSPSRSQRDRGRGWKGVADVERGRPDAEPASALSPVSGAAHKRPA